MKKKAHHKIANAYDAFWFIHDHPKFMLRERTPVEPEEADKLEAEGFLITRDTGGKCYREWRHLHRHAIDENLEIFYTKTNKPGGHGRVDDDRSKNKHVECWLEFGPSYYGYAYSGNKKPAGDWDIETMKHMSHDYRLDCGGTTFDQALVALARLVRKHYGDYRDRDGRDGACGRPCGDCRDLKSRTKKKARIISS